MSHSNSREGGGDEKSECRMGKRGDTTCGGDDGVSEKKKNLIRTTQATEQENGAAASTHASPGTSERGREPPPGVQTQAGPRIRPPAPR